MQTHSGHERPAFAAMHGRDSAILRMVLGLGVNAMRRREFMSLLGGAAAGWPLAARAQQPGRMRRIGVLTPLPADNPDAKARHAVFLESLRQLGWSEGHNVRIEARWSAGDPTITRKNAGNWSRSHLTLSWQLALWALESYSKRPVPCQSCW
jgi:hypothetical protein